MNELNIDALPVCESNRPIRMRNSHDIIVRGTAAGMVPRKKRIERATGNEARRCFVENSLDEVMRHMSATQIRRIPVVVRDVSSKLIDIVSIGDLVTKTSDGEQRQETGQVVEEDFSPSMPAMLSINRHIIEG